MLKNPLTPFIRSLNRASCLPIWMTIVAIAVLTLGLLPNAKGSQIPTATGTLTETATSAGSNTFALTLQNTSTFASIQTFWFGWVPGEDFLDSSPSSVTTPAGWTDSIHGGGGGSDGYSIEFTTSTTPLTAGSGLSGFGFTSADSLAQMAGNSTFYSGSAATTSVVNTGASESGNASVPFTVTVVPEPASAALIGGALFLCLWKTRRCG